MIEIYEKDFRSQHKVSFFMAADLSYTRLFRYRRPRLGLGHPASTSPVRSPGPGGLFAVHVLPLGIVQQLRMAFLQIPRRAVDLAGM